MNQNKTYEQEKQVRAAIYLILNPEVKLDIPVYKSPKEIKDRSK